MKLIVYFVVSAILLIAVIATETSWSESEECSSSSKSSTSKSSGSKTKIIKDTKSCGDKDTSKSSSSWSDSESSSECQSSKKKHTTKYTEPGASDCDDGNNKTCPEFEVYDECPRVKCKAEYCPKTRDDLFMCPYGIICDPPRCVCAFNRHRDRKSGKCILNKDCPPFPCNGPNEGYQRCPLGCPSEKCADFVTNATCGPPLGTRIGIVVPCQGQCKCKMGYYRNDDGVCVEPKKCPNYCKGVNEVFNPCSSSCPSQRCADIGVKVFCPKQPVPGDPNCKPACVCGHNFYRNAENVCVPKDECLKCKDPNEVYDECLKNCPPEDCKTRDAQFKCPVQPVPGDPKCKAGCRCRKDYFRNYDGLCVPRDKCTKKCTVAYEIWDDCPKTCPPQTCKSLNKTYHCPLVKKGVCSPGECRCIPGFYRNYLGNCISKENCLKCTGLHEYFSCGGACDNVCSTLRHQNQTKCPVINKKCNEMCYCEKDYARDENGICIPIADCPPSCPDNEIYSKCPTVKCDADFCPKSRDDPLSCPVGIVCDKPRCVCGFNSHRDWRSGKCIPTANCPPFPCNGPNEKYVGCPPPCPGEECSDFINNTTCPKFRIGIVVPCKPQCRCIKGYYRNSKKICILGKECVNDEGHNCIKPRENDTDLADFSKGNSDFTGKFFSSVLKANPGKSLIMSPLSILFAVAVFGPYSEGLTHDQILKALNFQSDAQIRATIPVWLNMLRSQQKVEINIANKIYAHNNYPLSDNFLEYTKTVFDAAAQNLDFSQSQQSADTINQWVEDQTHNRIQNLIPADALSSLTRLVVVNAIYFLGNWTKKFEHRNTKPRDYHLDNDTIIQLPTMFQKGNHKYSESLELDCKLLEMTYEGDNFSFLILLPNTYDGLEALAEKLTDSTVLNAAIDKMEEVPCDVYIPVMDISTSLNLKDPLVEIGLGQIFDETNYGLVNILKEGQNQDLYVSAALQKAILKVNEEGTEAAAATGVIGTTTSIPPPPKYEFNVDHPCIFQIKFNNDPLFCGAFVQ